MRPELVHKSRRLARVLRHKPELWGLKLDARGWCDVNDLLEGATRHGEALSQSELKEIVETNDKKRFTLSANGKRIRAAQGHSVEVDLGLRPAPPPPVLYHGTTRRNMAAIMREGLQPMKRHAVHLSATREVAVAVGSRRGAAAVLVVDSYRMHGDGFTFFLADNGVWLVDSVPPQYIQTRQRSAP